MLLCNGGFIGGRVASLLVLVNRGAKLNLSYLLLLSFQLKCCSNIDSIHYFGLTNSFDQVPRDIHTLPVKEPIPSI